MLFYKKGCACKADPWVLQVNSDRLSTHQITVNRRTTSSKYTAANSNTQQHASTHSSHAVHSYPHAKLLAQAGGVFNVLVLVQATHRSGTNSTLSTAQTKTCSMTTNEAAYIKHNIRSGQSKVHKTGNCSTALQAEEEVQSSVDHLHALGHLL